MHMHTIYAVDTMIYIHVYIYHVYLCMYIYTSARPMACIMISLVVYFSVVADCAYVCV
jgi:hypothetical protein